MSGMAIPATTRLRQRGLASWRRAAAPAAPGAARLPGLGLALLAAVLLPVLTLSAMSRISWLASWSGAERELSRSAEAAAEYAVRTIEAQRFAADVTNDLLQGLSDAEVRDREAELHQALARLAGRLALVRHITVSDREARVLLSTSTASVPQPLSLADRDWVIALRQPGAPRWHVSRLFAGRLDGRLFFAVNRRREAGGNGLAAGAYDGAISVSMDPNAVAAGFTALGGEPGDVTALVRSDGEVLVRTPGAQEALPPIPAGSALRRAAAEGRARGSYVGHPSPATPARPAPAGSSPSARWRTCRSMSPSPGRSGSSPRSGAGPSRGSSPSASRPRCWSSASPCWRCGGAGRRRRPRRRCSGRRRSAPWPRRGSRPGPSSAPSSTAASWAWRSSICGTGGRWRSTTGCWR
ncbi:hypothetical protein ACFQY5_06530 [Paeniroseomonas aquatica]|uniref:PDC sensor domain-containing protein n=1 Tax=Paeniroseomonas aquatica TaxID=373043 RepID=UPI0036152545